MIRIRRPFRTPSLAAPIALFLMTFLLVAPPAKGQNELSYEQYRNLSWAADRLNHVTKFEPMNGEEGMYFAVGERFGTVLVFKSDARVVRRAWKSIRLSGVPEELLVADLDGDGFDDSLLCRTNGAKVYVWELGNFNLVWESLQGEYNNIAGYTTGQMDDGQENEIVLLADNRVTYVDGVTFNKEYTTINEYNATVIRCGDVDGDGRTEIVLNSGQVVDSVSGEIEWEDEAFYGRIELLDMDGDGVPEVFTENENGGPLKVFDIDYRSEVRFQ